MANSKFYGLDERENIIFDEASQAYRVVISGSTSGSGPSGSTVVSGLGSGSAVQVIGTKSDGSLNVYDVSPDSYHAITHWSPVHGTSVYAGPNTLTLNFSFTVDDSCCSIAAITVFKSNNTSAIYENGINGITIRSANNVATVYGANGTPFINDVNELYRVAISAAPQTVDNAFDSEKVIVQNPDSAVVTYNSLYDGATTTETATTTAQMTVAVDRGRVILAGSSITNAGAGYTAGLHYLLVEFNGGIGAIFSYTSTGNTLAGGTLALVSGGYGYTASGTNVNVMLCEELPSGTGNAMNNNRRLSVNGLLHSTSTQSKMLMRVMATNEINANTALTNWVAVNGADTNSGTMVKEITTTTEDKVFMLDFDNFNYGFYKILYAYEKTTGSGTQIKTKESY